MSPDWTSGNSIPDQYRCHPMMRVPLGSQAELLYFPLTRAVQIISPSDATLLSSCGRFATINEHAYRICSGSTTLTDELPRIAEALRGLASRGTLMSLSELDGRILSHPQSEPIPRISCLSIPTCDRPDRLQRAIRSFGVNFRAHGRFPKLIVVDDSKTPEGRAATKAVTDEECRRWGAATSHIGVKEKQELATRLSKAGDIPPEVLEFGILGPGGTAQGAGANRNVILLNTLNELVLSVDDDTVCDPCTPPELDLNALRLGAEFDPPEYWFFPEPDSAFGFAQRADIDVLGEHERMLGQPLHSLVASRNECGGVDMESACGHVVRNLWDGKGRILITSNGHVGDSGMYSGRGLPLHTSAGTRARLLASEAAYRSALRSRYILRQVSTEIVSHGLGFISMFFGLDNRVQLPPFFPVGHCDDGIFAHIVNTCMPGCYFGYLPWAMVHDPVPGREYFASSATTVRISNIMMACVSAWTSSNRHGDALNPLRSLGRYLQDLATLSPTDFDEYVRILMLQQAGQRISYTEGLVRQREAKPEFWASDLIRENEENMAALLTETYSEPVDLPESGSRLRHAQSLLLRYGQLLAWWPAIIELMRGGVAER